MECEPTASKEILNVAVPLDRAAEPSVVAPSLKVTVPAGVPAPGATAATDAESVTVCPKTEGLGAGVTLVVVLAGFTVCVKTEEVLLLKLALPP